MLFFLFHLLNNIMLKRGGWGLNENVFFMVFSVVIFIVILTSHWMQFSHSQETHWHGSGSSSSSGSGQAQNQLGHSLVPHTQSLFRAFTMVVKLALAASQRWHSPVVWSTRGFVSGGRWSTYHCMPGNLRYHINNNKYSYNYLSLRRWAYSSLLCLSALSGRLVNISSSDCPAFAISSWIISWHSSLKFS